MALTPEQVQIVRSTIPVLQEYGKAITTSFYTTLLDEVPALHNIFNRTNQANGHQAATLASALIAYASHIDDLGALSPAVEKICCKHASLHVQPEHYSIVGEYLLRAMGDVLGSALTPEVLDAWGAAYWQLADVMMKREEQLSQEADGWTDWREFKIARKITESEEITSFYLEPVDGEKLPSFLPGQYVSIRIYVPQLQLLQARQFSLSDAPNTNYYRISVRKERSTNHGDGDTTASLGYTSNMLHNEKAIGDILEVSHPRGEFFLDQQQDKDSPIVLLSAGVGITPMMSILNSVTNGECERRISFVHGARSSSVRAFCHDVQHKALHHANITHTTFVKNPDPECDDQGRDYNHSGRLDLNKLDRTNELLLYHDRTQYFVCGPESFITDVKNGLLEMGVEQARIKSELFGAGLT